VENTEEDYINTISSGFRDFIGRLPERPKIFEKKLVIDCAHGYGSVFAHKLMFKALEGFMSLQLINEDNGMLLNEECGEDHVYTNKTLPKNYTFGGETLGATLDGDADRSIFL